MRSRWGPRLSAIVVLAFAALITASFPLAVHAADNTKIVDGTTKFHRVYVLGNGDSTSEDASFEDDLAELKGVLEKPGNQANGSTSRILRKPTKDGPDGLRAALAAVIAGAYSGDEITLYFDGHGGGGTEYGAGDLSESGEPDHADEHFRLNGGGGSDSVLYDDELPDMLTGMRPGVTLLVILESCFGAGFTGGADDLAENDNVKVIGAKGCTPVDPPWLLGWLVDTITEDIADAADVVGTVTGDQVETYLQGEGWQLGPPDGTEEVKGGKGKVAVCPDPECAAGADLPTLTIEPDVGPPAPEGFTTQVSGEDFGSLASVNIELIRPNGTQLALGSASADDQGSFSSPVTITEHRGDYLVYVTDDQGFDDWSVVTATGPVGGIAQLPELETGSSQLEGSDSSGLDYGFAAIVGAAVAAGVVALGAATWYARRRCNS
jgi:hypothetical protein